MRSSFHVNQIEIAIENNMVMKSVKLLMFSFSISVTHIRVFVALTWKQWGRGTVNEGIW